MHLKDWDSLSSAAHEARCMSRTAFMTSVFLQMGMSVALSGAVAFTVMNEPALQRILTGPDGLTVAGWIVLLAPLLLVLVLGARTDRFSGVAARATLIVYASLVGLSLGTIFIGLARDGLIAAFSAAAYAFVALAILAGLSRRDLSGMGNFLTIALVGFTVALCVNLLLGSASVDLALALVGVLLFAALVAYDTQRLEGLYEEVRYRNPQGAASLGALTLYLDFINLFLSLLRFTGHRR